ncbi:c-type cytochrome [Gemmobacter denitrificans]|uniref:C-type cytochrome n=1 Tax=Gemmobacter denitrificans TaxID=3123040 RepID=A0ABU8BTF8_9RHOB
MTPNCLTRTALACLALAAAAPAAQAEQGLDEAIKIEAGKAFFASECQRCHSIDADRQTYGPPLENIIGRPAGSVADYAYSPALAKAGFTWTEGALIAWMEDNQAFVPGTRMRHVGITDPVVQAFIVAWLKDAARSAQ